MATLIYKNERSLLRARGGISYSRIPHNQQGPSSPRTRRYFRAQPSFAMCTTLFSAHAEVFPTSATQPKNSQTLLRARGGISI